MPYFWGGSAWSDYQYRQAQDRKTLRKTNALLKEIARAGANGNPAGKAELLKGTREAPRSARIDSRNRLVYRVEGDTVYVVSCRGRYNDK